VTSVARPVDAPPGRSPSVEAFERHLAASPAQTRKAYLRDASILVELCGDRDPLSLSRAELARFLATLHGRGLSGRSLARMLSAWRAFYRYLLDGAASNRPDPCAGLKAPKSPRRLPSALSPDEASRVVAGGGDDPLGRRDRALFELAYSSGLRLSELAGLDCERLDLEGGEVKVLGKGGKERIVPVGAPALVALRAWLADRASLARPHERALFVGIKGRRISPRTIQARLAAHALAQGLDRHVHPHMLRHSFASHVLQSSGDLRAVQELLGHASIASTQVYTHLDYQYLAKAYDAAHPRARRRKS
jgi:integrase/recombinase XerC